MTSGNICWMRFYYVIGDFRKYLLDEVLLRNSDNVMDGRLEMSGHKIKGLGNPVDSDDAVNKEYITTK